MTTKPTRRGVLAGMAGGAATAALPATTAATLATGGVDPLVALEAEYLEDYAAYDAAALAVDNAEGERWLHSPDYVPGPG